LRATDPSIGATSPAIERSRVVLPIPEAPAIEMTSPGYTSIVMPEIKGASYPTDRSLNESRASGVLVDILYPFPKTIQSTLTFRLIRG
jgi:hypothetical protein